MNGRSVRRLLPKPSEKGGKKKRQKSRRTGYNDPFTLSSRDYFTSTPSSSSFSHLKNKHRREKSRGNDSLMLPHKNPVASLPVVFLPRPGQTPDSKLQTPNSELQTPRGEITTGKCFPSHTLGCLGILPMKLRWKLLPIPRSSGYLQATGKAWDEAGKEGGTSWRGLSPALHGRRPWIWAAGPFPAHPSSTSWEYKTYPSFYDFFPEPTPLFDPSSLLPCAGNPIPLPHSPTKLPSPQTPLRGAEQHSRQAAAPGSLPASLLSPGWLRRQRGALCASGTPPHGHIGAIMLRWPQSSGIIFFLAPD